LEDALQKQTGAPLYEGPVIDAHHHLWDLSLGRHPWLTGGINAVGGLDKIASNYDVVDYLSDIGSDRLVGSVFVEALWDGDPLEEIQWIEGICREGMIADRYVAAARLGSETARDLIDQYSRSHRVRGVRSVLSWHPDESKTFVHDPHLSRRPEWLRDVELLAKSGLHLEVMMYPYQASDVFDLANTFPELQIVVNHCGSPIDRDDEGMRRWRGALQLLGSVSNVSVKVSNASIYDPDWDVESLTHVTDVCFKCFGAGRVMYGSDLPVSKINMDGHLTFDTARHSVSHQPESDQSAFFYENARKLYRFEA